MEDKTYTFRDLTKLTKWLKFFLVTDLVINFIAVLGGLFTYGFLKKVERGFYVSQELLSEAADLSDMLEGFIGVAQIITIFITGILFLRWIYLANYNAHALGANEMKFTPKWSILWYIIPIWNLWKPYQAMKEIWKCSQNPAEWKTLETYSIVKWWWFFWIFTNLLSQVVFRLNMRAKEIPELISGTYVSIVADFMSIPLDILAILLVSSIFSMQMVQKGLRGK